MFKLFYTYKKKKNGQIEIFYFNKQIHNVRSYYLISYLYFFNFLKNVFQIQRNETVL